MIVIKLQVFKNDILLVPCTRQDRAQDDHMPSIQGGDMSGLAALPASFGSIITISAAF